MPYVKADTLFMVDRFHLRHRLMSNWPAAAIATMIIMLVGCGTGTPPVEVPRARIWRDKEAERILKLVAKTNNLCCYRYEGCFLDFFHGDSQIHMFHADDSQKIVPGQATWRSGLTVVVRADKAEWEVTSQERFSWEKVQQNASTKKTVDVNDLGEFLSKELLSPGNSSGSSEATNKGYSFTLPVPEDLDVDFAKENIGVIDYFKDSKEILVPDDEPITLARFEIVGKDGKVHGGWDLRCVKVKPKPEEKAD